MEGKDEIQELFAQKLGSYEAKVDSKLWSNVADTLKTLNGAAIGSKGLTIAPKWWIAGSMLTFAMVIIGILAITQGNDSQLNVVSQEHQKIEPVVETIQAEKKLETAYEEQRKIQDRKISKKAIEKNQNKIEKEVGKGTVSEHLNEEGHPFLIEREHLVAEDHPLGVEQEWVHRDVPRAQEGLGAAEKGKESQRQEPQGNTANIASDDAKFMEPKGREEVSQPAETNEHYSIVRLPNIFSPNGDGKNDFFFVEVSGLSDFHIVILNERSEMVFASEDINFRWDGIDLKGNPVPVGQYVYYFTAVSKNRQELVKEYRSLTIAR